MNFITDEAEFNVIVLQDLSKKLQTPADIMEIIISKNLVTGSKEDIIASVKNICGEYAGLISPYIYELSLSNTQSRRSRAGSTFQEIIYELYNFFNYSFASQKSVGRKTFETKGLGKIVDSILPGIEEFSQRRDKVVIGTMKTTLRERWQEVVEEISRTNVPHIYLLTMDDKISKEKATQMAEHNVVIVVKEEVKNQEKLKKMKN